MPRFKRILLKLSGEALSAHQGSTILSIETLQKYGRAVKKVVEAGVDVAIVVGGGNIWRGKLAQDMGMERSTADYMGMLGTIINALALQSVFEQMGLQTRVQTALQVNAVAEPFIRRRALRHLEKGRIMIFGGGNGIPYFSTDTTAALRAAEIGADCILMAKNGVDGVYTGNPKTDPKAKLISETTYMEILQKDLRVLDGTALTLCMENNIDMIVFNLDQEDTLYRIINGEKIGTHIRKGA